MRHFAELGRPPSRTEVDHVAASPAKLDEVLVRLAHAAADNDLEAMHTLLYAIESQRLAEPGIRRVVFQPDDVSDVSQDVLIAVAESIGAFRGEGRFTSWLFSVARNKAVQFVRRQRDESPLRTELADTERISSLIATNLSIRELLLQLPTPLRVAVTLRDLEGLPYTDIAEKLELNLNTVRSHIARGRAMLASIATAQDG